jgi:hypothetical protein
VRRVDGLVLKVHHILSTIGLHPLKVPVEAQQGCKPSSPSAY